MGANIAGIYGAQIFRSEDKPLYLRGFSINLAILSTAIVLAIVRTVDDLIRGKRRRKNELDGSSSDNAQTIEVDDELKGAAR